MAHTAVCWSGEDGVEGTRCGCLDRMGFNISDLSPAGGFEMSFSDVYLRYQEKGQASQPNQNWQVIGSKAWTLS